MGATAQDFGPTLRGVTVFHRYGSSRACGLELEWTSYSSCFYLFLVVLFSFDYLVPDWL